MRFEFIAGALCLDFANTIHDSRAKDKDKQEELHAFSDLLQWAKEAGLLSSSGYDRLGAHYKQNPRQAAVALDRSIAIRDLLIAMFTGIANGRPVSSQHLSALNAALGQAPGLLHVRTSTSGIETGWTSATNGLQQVFFAVLRSAAELLAGDRRQRIRECASKDCTWLFVDESRNHSRRWCDMNTCGNRMKARRHYRKVKA